MEDEKELIALKMADLIVRQLNAELNASEEAGLQLWLDADPAHLALYEEMADKHSRGKALTDIKQYDVKAAFQRFESKIKTPSVKLWPRIAAAAAILLVVGLGVFFYTQRHLEGSGATRDLLANDIKPGGNKAYLVLSNGKRVSLTDAANGELAKEAGVEITKTADGQVVYATRGSDEESSD
ncbi:MAG TPA: hypothetical protein VNZ46_15915, partial [Pedobacter sp.]|nr:hypothetical protein [Pedobacter sp.]